ncbi:hypothetical protein AB1Y20_006083 [Prymnesium parvum]|uniref:Uncharacterized protein n=1 Tax=Prymnesium parvum TaxID=97485 RepID=A0AB34J349_PRYPA
MMWRTVPTWPRGAPTAGIAGDWDPSAFAPVEDESAYGARWHSSVAAGSLAAPFPESGGGVAWIATQQRADAVGRKGAEGARRREVRRGEMKITCSTVHGGAEEEAIKCG